MEESRKKTKDGLEDLKGASRESKSKKTGLKKNKVKFSTTASEDRDVLIKAGPLKYKIPGKQQRVIIGSIVLGLNLLLVIAVFVYFKSPAFQDFIYNLGRT